MKITQKLVTFGGFVFALSFVACDQQPKTALIQNEQPYVSDPHSVGFDIALLSDTKDSQQWLASYASPGKMAKFRIELNKPEELKEQDSKRFGIKSGKGRLIAEPRSDARILLNDLKIALRSKDNS